MILSAKHYISKTRYMPSNDSHIDLFDASCNFLAGNSKLFILGKHVASLLMDSGHSSELQMVTALDSVSSFLWRYLRMQMLPT